MAGDIVLNNATVTIQSPTINVYGNPAEVLQRLDQIADSQSTLLAQGVKMDQDVSDLQQAVSDVNGAVDQLPGLVDAFEARITDLVKNQSIPADARAAIQQATADLRNGFKKVSDAISDAADGIDEAANAGGGDTGTGGDNTGGTGGTGGTDTGTGGTGNT